MTRSGPMARLPLSADPAMARHAPTSPLPTSMPPTPLIADPFSGEIAIDILLLPGFHLGDLSALADVFQRANAAAPIPGPRQDQIRRRFRWRLIAPDRAPVASSCGCHVTPAAGIDPQPDPSRDPWLNIWPGAANTLLLAGHEIPPEQDRERLTGFTFWLRHRQRCGGRIVAVGAATLLLAQAGLIGGRRAAAPWQCIDAWQEMHKEVRFDDRLFVQDDRITTCCGNGAALDFALHCVARLIGSDRARHIADQLNYARPRDGAETQRPWRFAALGIEHPGFIKALTLMHREIEQPLGTADIAAATGLGLRQLQRLFQRHYGVTPSEYYLQCRLDRARSLLCQTSMKVTEIAVATGFVSMSHFSRCYRARFGAAPRTDRQNADRQQTARPETHRSKTSRVEPGALRTRTGKTRAGRLPQASFQAVAPTYPS